MKFIQKPKVSIIIPSYNIKNKKYLKKAINSVLNQNLKNIELIVIDDKATDNTPIILDNYALNEKRITIIHKRKNEMTGYARNTGLNFIMGEYLGFLDYDDLFHPNALLFAYSEAKKQNYTVVHFDFKLFKNEKKIMKDIKNLNNNYKIEILKENYTYPLGKTGIYVWSNIYKSSFILSHNFKFVNTWADEDVLFCISLYSYRYDILLIKKFLVFHRLLSSSVAHNPKKFYIRKKLILFHLRNIFKNWKKKEMMKERLIENSYNYIIRYFFRKDIKTYINFLKFFKSIFSDYDIRQLYIKSFNMKNINYLYTNNKIKFNIYESV